MPDTNTTVLGLVKPEVGASTDTWGPKYHSALDAIDGLFTDPAKKMLKLANGGTGADTAAGARTAFGLGALAILGAVGTAQITDASVTTAKIADAAVTAAKLASGLSFPAGTRLLFQQTAAPTGWTKVTTHDNKALRVVSGSVGSGGTVNFTTAFANRTVSGTSGSTTAGGTVGNTTLTESQIPSHRHLAANNSVTTDTLDATDTIAVQGNYGGDNNYILAGSTTAANRGQTSLTGGGAAHTHTFTGTGHTHSFSAGLDLAVEYVDVIIAEKN
jgi:hypothetical protein